MPSELTAGLLTPLAVGSPVVSPETYSFLSHLWSPAAVSCLRPPRGERPRAWAPHLPPCSPRSPGFCRPDLISICLCEPVHSPPEDRQAPCLLTFMPLNPPL